MQYVLSTKAGEGGQYLPVKNASEIYEPNAKHVELDDEWETFIFRFSVMNSLENPHDEIFLSSEILGDKLVKLEKVKVPQKWMFAKYGAHVTPYECFVKLPNVIAGSDGQFSLKDS